LWDYDGVWVQAMKESFSIMRAAIGGVLEKQANRKAIEMDALDWPKIFGDTKGFTEHTFVSTVFEALGIHPTDRDRLFTHFIQERAELIAFYNRKHGLRKFDDHNVFIDAKVLALDLKKRFPDALHGLVTGNPLWVIEQRLPLDTQNVFDIRIGGEYGRTRRDLLGLAIIHAKKLGWKGYRDADNMWVNAFYFDDAKAGAFSALEGGFKTVFLDRPETQTAHHRIFDESMLNATIVTDLMERFGDTKTARLVIGQLGVTTQSVFTTQSLDNYWLLRPAQHMQMKYEGWLQPALHAQWQVHEDEEREVAFPRKEM